VAVQRGGWDCPYVPSGCLPERFLCRSVRDCGQVRDCRGCLAVVRWRAVAVLEREGAGRPLLPAHGGMGSLARRRREALLLHYPNEVKRSISGTPASIFVAGSEQSAAQLHRHQGPPYASNESETFGGRLLWWGPEKLVSQKTQPSIERKGLRKKNKRKVSLLLHLLVFASNYGTPPLPVGTAWQGTAIISSFPTRHGTGSKRVQALHTTNVKH
jgi:hypothetical protein